MKRSVEFDDELAAQVEDTAELVHENQAVVIRMAVRAGLSTVRNSFQAPRPNGYFADAYKDGGRAKLEDAMAEATVQRPER